jgi:DNA-binding CsgD family transcriptional regulator
VRQSDCDPTRLRTTLAFNPSVRRLTGREHEIARLIAGGLKNAAIARRLGLSESTVAAYTRHIRQRLKLGSREEIAAWVTARLDPDNPAGRLRRVDGDSRPDL